ncbi:hypothetical protein MTO96_038040 [Rhipicephalus appendiculatus]
MVTFNGYFGCTWCLMRGEHKEGSLRYTMGFPAEARTTSRVKEQMELTTVVKDTANGLKGPTALMNQKGRHSELSAEEQSAVYRRCGLTVRSVVEFERFVQEMQVFHSTAYKTSRRCRATPVFSTLTACALQPTGDDSCSTSSAHPISFLVQAVQAPMQPSFSVRALQRKTPAETLLRPPHLRLSGSCSVGKWHETQTET